jgi:tetratricopeptide (TPR) repeat protein
MSRAQRQKFLDNGEQALIAKNYAEACKHFSRALEVSERSGDPLDRVESLTGLGCAQAANKQYAAAEQTYSRAVALSVAASDYEQEGLCLASLAAVYKELGRNFDCRDAASRAFDILFQNRFDQPEAMVVSMVLLAESMVLEKHFDLAASAVTIGRVIAELAPPGSVSQSSRERLEKQAGLTPKASFDRIPMPGNIVSPLHLVR